MFRSRCLTYLAGLMLILSLCGGCSMPAQMHWSPDGSAAAYQSRGRAIVVDPAGALLSQLGRSDGGFAWSADSKTLYYATAVDDADQAVEVDDKWRAEDAPPPTNPADPNEKRKFIQLNAWNNRKTTALVKFRADSALYMLLSPNQDWLAIACKTGNSFSTFAFHLSGKRVYGLSDVSCVAMCFTGKNRLAFIESAGSHLEKSKGQVVEVMLDPKSATLPRTPLLDVVAGETYWLGCVGDDLLLTAVARTVPGPAISREDQLNHIKLFMWTRANGGIVAVADNAGPLFSVSPDGSRVMIHKITPKTDKRPMTAELMVIRTNGAEGLTLRTLARQDDLQMWPAWRGNGEIAWTAPDAKPNTVGGEPRLQYDVLLYQLTEKGELTGGRLLSESWDPDLIPYKKAEATQKTD